MTDFLRRIPAPSRMVLSDAPLGSFALAGSDHNSRALQPITRRSPPYGSRSSWIPKTLADFADGGAFPEIHIAQFPLDMGKKRENTGKTVALQIGPDGRLEYDAVVRQNSGRALVYSKPGDQNEKWMAAEKLQRPEKEAEDETLKKTKAALEAALNQKMAATQVCKTEKKDAEFFRYTPKQQGANHNSNCSQRIVRMVEMQVDPLSPAKFRHKRVPRGPPSPPPPVQHSPPRKLTQKDQQEWKIPPSVSNWKNQKGYTIPLDKRLQADGRGLQDVAVSDKFAAFSECLYIAERSAREEIRIRNEMLKQKKAKEEEMREQQLRELAAKARAERSNLLQSTREQGETVEETESRKQREQLEVERKKELERSMRMEKSGRKKRNRDEGRDISERIALGQAQPTSQEAMFDARLFNQSDGMDSGFSAGNDEAYAVYDKPLFTDRSAAGIYRFEKERFQQSIGELDGVPSFAGADKSKSSRTAPVEFEKDVADPFGLDNLLSEAKKK